MAFLGPSAHAAGKVFRPVGSNPHNRGYESLTPGDPNGFTAGMARSSSDPNRVWAVFQGPNENSNDGFLAHIRAERHASGWEFHDPAPSARGNASTIQVVGLTDDFLTAIWVRVPGLLAFPGTPIFERVGPNGGITHLSGPAADDAFGGFGSTDLSQYYIPSILDQDPADTNGQPDIYSIGTGRKELVGRLPGPGGLSDPAPACGSANEFYDNNSHQESERRVSVDGRRIYFYERDENDCLFGPLKGLYVRDRGDLSTPHDDRTVQVNAPQVPGEPMDEVTFVQASRDGSRVIYVSRTQMQVLPGTAADTNDTPDIYLYTLDVGNQCLTCIVPRANVNYGLGDGFGTSVAVAQDLSRIYFASAEDLVPGVPSGIKIYRLKGDDLQYVAPASTTWESKVTTKQGRAGQLSPDGRFLLFASDAPELNAMTGSDNGGRNQYYRYDDEAPFGERLACVSCPAGPATADVPRALGSGGGLHYPNDRRFMSDDGRVIAFPTYDSLVPEDVNHDLDLYEWADGQHTLLTDGQSVHPDNAQETVYDVSADGTNILIKTYSELLPGLNAATGAIVNVRRSGGFPVLEVPRGGCEGDACQGRPTPSPSFAFPGSVRDGMPDGDVDAPAFRVDRISAAQRRALARRGQLTLRVRANSGGTVDATMRAKIARRLRAVARARAAVDEGGVAMLRLRLSRAAQRALRANGRLGLRIEVQYSELAAPKVMRITVKSVSRRPAHRRARGR